MDDDARIEAFYAREGRWKAEKSALRAILRDTDGIEEVWKWRAPCYTCAGGNTAMVAGYAERCGISFFKGVLLSDPEGVLVAPGPNSRAVRTMVFQDPADIAARETVLRRYITEAVELDRAGRRVVLPKDDIDLPEELVAALDADPALAEAFAALTPGRQRGYALTIAGAKQSATRYARIEKWTPRIFEGKGIHDR